MHRDDEASPSGGPAGERQATDAGHTGPTGNGAGAGEEARGASRAPVQRASRVPVDEARGVPLLPLRMMAQYVYCPRLFVFMWAEREWADSGDTVRGRTVHRNVDRAEPGVLPDADEEAPRAVRSLSLASERLGLVGKADLVQVDGRVALPIEYKKGRAPEPVGEGAWPGDRVQVCGQALLLRELGYQVERALVWYAGSRRRVEVPIDDALVAETLAARDRARELAASGHLPRPLVDSRKCNGCSLVGICLPDETRVLSGQLGAPARPLVPARDDGIPLYVQVVGGFLGRDGDEIVVRDRGEEVGRAPIAHTSAVVTFGRVSLSGSLVSELHRRGIPLSLHSSGGWLQGYLAPAGGHNVLGRIAQHRVAADPSRSLDIARRMVYGKIANARVLLRRNGRQVHAVVQHLGHYARRALDAADIDELLGIEGQAAAIYFRAFGRMVRSEVGESFAFRGRNRRPPRDPVNALLSFAYGQLVREARTALQVVGLDPEVGVYHRPRFGRPALALDLMEEFRPLIAESVVVRAINNGEVQEDDFIVHPAGCSLTRRGRGKFLRAFSQRMDQAIRHPVFGTRLSYRRILEVQARILSRVFRGEMEYYRPMVTR